MKRSASTTSESLISLRRTPLRGPFQADRPLRLISRATRAVAELTSRLTLPWTHRPAAYTPPGSLVDEGLNALRTPLQVNACTLS